MGWPAIVGGFLTAGSAAYSASRGAPDTPDPIVIPGQRERQHRAADMDLWLSRVLFPMVQRRKDMMESRAKQKPIYEMTREEILAKDKPAGNRARSTRVSALRDRFGGNAPRYAMMSRSYAQPASTSQPAQLSTPAYQPILQQMGQTAVPAPTPIANPNSFMPTPGLM